MRTLTLILLALLPALAHGQAATTRPSVRIVDATAFAHRPATPDPDALPRAAEISPATMNTARDPDTYQFRSRAAYWQKIDKKRLADLLAPVPAGGVCFVTPEGDPAAEYGVDRSPDDNHKAHLFLRRVIRAAKAVRPDVQVLLDCRPVGRVRWDWDRPPAAPDEADRVAALSAELRATLAIKECDGAAVECYFHKRWHNRFHNDFIGPMRFFAPQGIPWAYPGEADDARYLTPGEPERFPEFIDLSNTTTGWVHETQVNFVGLQQYGRPVSVIIAPGYGYMSRFGLFNRPLSDDDRNECVRRLRALGPASVILYGSLIQGQAEYPDGGRDFPVYPWQADAPWVAAWRAEAAK